MAIICSVDYSTALGYKGMNLSAKYNNKKHKVYLKLNCDDYILEDGLSLARVSKNILMVNYQGIGTSQVYLGLTNDTGIYVGRVMDFGNDITEEDIERLVINIPEGITPIIKLPEDFTNLRFIWEVSKKFPRVRFCGGKLFAIEGVKVGAIGVDVLDRVEAKYGEDAYSLGGRVDALEEVDISTLEIKASSKAERTGNSTKRGSSGSTASKKKVTRDFTDLFDKFQLGGM